MLSAATVVAMTDKWAAMGLASGIPPVGTVTTHSTPGIGDIAFLSLANREATADYGAHYKACQMTDILVDSDNLPAVLGLLVASQSLENALCWQRLLATPFMSFLTSMNAASNGTGLSGVSNLNTFVSYMNTGQGGPFNCLLCPDFANIFNQMFPTSPVTPANVYSPPIASMGSFVIGAGFVSGTAVNTALYGGVGACQITASGITGTGGVTVTGLNQAGIPAQTWTATVTGDGIFTLTPTAPTDILQSVTGIACGGGLTAGTVVVNGLIPIGRQNPPT